MTGVILRILRQPAVRTLKRRLTDAWWSARGAAIENPPFPQNVRSVLFICKGNICRSPFAAERFSAMLTDARVTGVRTSSAGIQINQAATPPMYAVEAARAFGLSLARHRPRQLTGELLAEHDVAIVMEADQLRALRQRYPDSHSRIVLLPLLQNGFAGYARYHIADPYGHPLTEFESCYERIDRALGDLLRSTTLVRDVNTSSMTTAGQRRWA